MPGCLLDRLCGNYLLLADLALVLRDNVARASDCRALRRGGPMVEPDTAGRLGADADAQQPHAGNPVHAARRRMGCEPFRRPSNSV